jgi:hypothetical protein
MGEIHIGSWFCLTAINALSHRRLRIPYHRKQVGQAIRQMKLVGLSSLTRALKPPNNTATGLTLNKAKCQSNMNTLKPNPNLDNQV